MRNTPPRFGVWADAGPGWSRSAELPAASATRAAPPSLSRSRRLTTVGWSCMPVPPLGRGHRYGHEVTDTRATPEQVRQLSSHAGHVVKPPILARDSCPLTDPARWTDDAGHARVRGDSMHVGIFVEELRYGASQAQAFRDIFEQVDQAEALGIDCVWLGEIPSTPTRSVISASLQVASAIASRTRRLRVGTAVQVLPLNHPLRIAEEVATVDHISEGR